MFGFRSMGVTNPEAIEIRVIWLSIKCPRRLGSNCTRFSALVLATYKSPVTGFTARPKLMVPTPEKYRATVCVATSISTTSLSGMVNWMKDDQVGSVACTMMPWAGAGGSLGLVGGGGAGASGTGMMVVASPEMAK